VVLGDLEEGKGVANMVDAISWEDGTDVATMTVPVSLEITSEVISAERKLLS